MCAALLLEQHRVRPASISVFYYSQRPEQSHDSDCIRLTEARPTSALFPDDRQYDHQQ